MVRKGKLKERSIEEVMNIPNPIAVHVWLLCWSLIIHWQKTHVLINDFNAILHTILSGEKNYFVNKASVCVRLSTFKCQPFILTAKALKKLYTNFDEWYGP
jgi:hypothetical protein